MRAPPTMFEGYVTTLRGSRLVMEDVGTDRLSYVVASFESEFGVRLDLVEVRYAGGSRNYDRVTFEVAREPD